LSGQGEGVIEPTVHKILVVDDNVATTRLLKYLLTAEGHEVMVAGDGLEALARIARSRPDLILLDLELPRVSGYDVCRQIKQDPSTMWIPIIILTGQSASEFKMHCWELGADDFLPKPFQNVEVVARCRSLLRVKRLHDELDSAEAVVFALARAVEAKSLFTHGHSERVRDYTLLLADKAGIPKAQLATLEKGALLHDIGKISVPDAVLNKPGPLTAEELFTIKQHTVLGAHIVEPLRSVRSVIPMIRSHHERCDGKGYPDCLHGDAIPLEVRILSVADVYDALASVRPYRPALSHDHCLEMLIQNAARGGLDPDLVCIFCELMAEGVPADLRKRREEILAKPMTSGFMLHPLAEVVT
jgi:putative two-component system response regulator